MTLDPLLFEELKASGKLPSPSGVALAIIKLLQREDYRIDDLAHLVQSDPVIAGRILKFANSAAFGQTRPIVSLPRAVTVLGAFRVRDLVLGFSVLHSQRTAPCGSFDLQRFWSRSLATAIANQELAPYARMASEENFTVGLLASIGELAMAVLHPDEYPALVGRSAGGLDQIGLEQQRFGMDHRELCAALLAEWGLPEPLVLAAYHHEQPDRAGFTEGSRHQLMALALHFSRRLAEMCIAGDRERWGLMPELVTIAARLGIVPEEMSQIADRVVQGWHEWGRTLEIETQEMPPFAELLATASPAASLHRPQRLDAGFGQSPLLLVASPDQAAQWRDIVQPLADWDVAAAHTSEEGLRLAVSGGFSILMLQLLPSTVAFCQAIRQSAATQHTYLIIVAPPGEEALLNEAIRAGADDFLLLPFSPQAAELRLRNALRVLALKNEVQRERLGIMRTADQLAGEHRRLMHSAMTDPLTKLPNRRHGEDFLASEWSSARECSLPLACLMLDIDHFKQVNDGYGHDAGDAVLSQLAGLIKRNLRSEDLAFRYGGEEFAVVCPGANRHMARSVGERIRAAVAQQPFLYGAQRLSLTVSIGVANLSASQQSYNDLLQQADQALYAAKQSGRNRVECFQ